MPSVGLDLVEIGRVQKAMKRSRFCRKILGGEEYRQLEKRGFPPQSVAASFSAKEAFSKAIGTGVRGFSLADVELLRQETESPIYAYKRGQRRQRRKPGLRFSPLVLPIRGNTPPWQCWRMKDKNRKKRLLC